MNYEEFTNEDLVELAQEGDEKAYNKLFEKNEKLPHLVTAKYTKLGSMEYEDYVGLCQFGMMKAYKTFNPEKKVKFISYATTCMENEILMDIRKNKKRKSEVSLQNSVIEDESLQYEDMLEDESAQIDFEKFIEKDYLKRVVVILKDDLSEREYYIFKRTIIDGISQYEVAKEIGMTQSYVSRLVNVIKFKIHDIAKSIGVFDGQEREYEGLSNNEIIKNKLYKDLINRGNYNFITYRTNYDPKAYYLFTEYPDMNNAKVSKVLGVEVGYVWNLRKKFREGTLDLDEEVNPKAMERRITMTLDHYDPWEKSQRPSEVKTTKIEKEE